MGLRIFIFFFFKLILMAKDRCVRCRLSVRIYLCFHGRETQFSQRLCTKSKKTILSVDNQKLTKTIKFLFSSNQ